MKSIVLLFFLYSCASVVRDMPGETATSLNKPIENLNVSGQVDKQISIGNYRLINLFFHNDNDDWLRVLYFDVLNQSGFNVILPMDLTAWMKSVKLNRKLQIQKDKKEKLKKRYLPLNDYKVEDYVIGNFSMPSKLKTQKWLLIQVLDKKKLPKKLSFLMRLNTGQSSTYEVELK